MAIRTQDLLEAAAAVTASEDGALTPRLAQFAGIYLDWILAQRGMSLRTADRRDKTSLMLHCLVNAQTLSEALRSYARYTPLLWGETWLIGVRDAGARVELILGAPMKPGVTGLVDDIWTLARLASELEWLVHDELAGISGRVRHAPLIHRSVAALLFSHDIEYGEKDLVLSIPKSHLPRPVVAQAGTIDEFCASLPLRTLSPEARRFSTRALIAELLRKIASSESGTPLTMEGVARLLRKSPTTLSRGLRREGTHFRDVKGEVFDELATDWLARSDLTVEAIAGKLRYSDAFAFRRWFRGRFGLSPTAFRKERSLSDGRCS